MKIGVINLSVEPDDDVLKWAAKKIQDNSQAYFIVVTHKYLLDDGKRDNYQSFGKGGNTGEKIWQKLIRSNCDVKLVLSGHFHKIDGEANIVSKNNCKDDVIQVMQDYQNRELGGNGLLRIYTFIPSEHKVQVKTYSPYTKTFEVDSDSQFEFSL
jgi:hypothetical protein